MRFQFEVLKFAVCFSFKDSIPVKVRVNSSGGNCASSGPAFGDVWPVYNESVGNDMQDVLDSSLGWPFFFVNSWLDTSVLRPGRSTA